MALVSDIILQAFRASNYIAIGEVPTMQETDEALPVFRNLLSSLFGFEIGEQLRDWFAPSNYQPVAPLRVPPTPTGINDPHWESWAFPPSNSRLIVNFSAATTLYFPAEPSDGARMAYVINPASPGVVTLNGNGRKIEGAATVVAVDSRKWMYRADLADWIRIDTVIDASDTAPLPEEFDDLLVCGLAMRLAPRFQVQADGVIVARFTDMLGRLKKRYKQTEAQPSNPELQQIIREI